MAADNEPHTGTPDAGLHGEAESTDDADEGSYVDADRGGEPDPDDPAEADDDADDDADDTGHYVESNDGSGHHDTHPEHGEYVEHDSDEVPPD